MNIYSTEDALYILQKEADRLDDHPSAHAIKAAVSRLKRDIDRLPKSASTKRRVGILKRIGKFLLHESYRISLLTALSGTKLAGKTSIIYVILAIISQVGGSMHAAAVFYLVAAITSIISSSLSYRMTLALEKLKKKNIGN